MKTKQWIGAGLLGTVLAFGGAAQAATVICPNTISITTDREHSLTTASAATCLAWGNGNLQGQTGQSDFFTAGVGSAYTILDKDIGDALPGIELLFTVSGINNQSAAFTIDPSLWTLYSSLAVGFTAGDGQVDNRWAVFGLATGTLSGDWTSDPNQAGGLSHANLYGIRKNDVPEPISLALLGLGLLGVGAARRLGKGQKA